MQFPPGLVSAQIVRRLNRFAVEVELESSFVPVHLPNSGRVRELLVPGAPVLLRPCLGEGFARKTAFDLLLVRVGEQWVSADASLPNPLVLEALAAGRLPAFGGYSQVRAEARFAGSRIDFLLEGPQGSCLLETKSVTLVAEGRALFPDAPTLRGTRHLRALMEAVRCGHRAAVLFVAQRADVQAFAPYDMADPLFGRTLREASAVGVSVLAYRCSVSPEGMELSDAIPVCL